MNNNKKNKTNDNSVDDYMSSISYKYEKHITYEKRALKINDENIIIPTSQNYYDVTKYNYNLNQLKMIAKYHKLKISGNKKELVTRIIHFLYFSFYITKIQKIFRGILQRKYDHLRGPAFIKRNLCTNETDFITLEPIKEIELNQFISYKDNDNFIYGFDIISIYNLICKNKKDAVLNPYTRAVMPDLVLKNIRSLIKLSRILKKNINLNIEDDCINISGEKAVELRTLSLFQYIDSLGNYSDPQWFLSLPRVQLIKFVRELSDIWNYRAQLSIEIKRNICPPYGDPFRNLSMTYLHGEPNLTNVRKSILEVLEKLVNSGTDTDSKCLGAYYLLGALTLVNETASIALPWLFQSVSYF